MKNSRTLDLAASIHGQIYLVDIHMVYTDVAKRQYVRIQSSLRLRGVGHKRVSNVRRYNGDTNIPVYLTLPRARVDGG